MVMTWVPFTIVSDQPDLTYIRENMGLAYEVKDPLDPSPVPLRANDTLDKPLETFIDDLFASRPELQQLQFMMYKRTQSEEEGSSLFRSISAVRTAKESKGRSIIQKADQIDGRVVEHACEEVFSIFEDGFTPPPPHETRTARDILQMFPFMYSANLDEVENLREQFEGPRVERAARTAVRARRRDHLGIDFGTL